MNIAGIVAEYNPFHSGHEYHLAKTRELLGDDCAFVCVMTDLLIPWYYSVIIVIVATIILGVVIERVAYKPLRDAPRMSIMISAIGVSYLLENLATYIFSAQPKSYPYDKMGFLSQRVTLGNISTTLVTFITPVLTIVLVLALVVLVRKTKIGMALKTANTGYVMETGRITLSGTGAELLANESVKAAYLGT